MQNPNPVYLNELKDSDIYEICVSKYAYIVLCKIVCTFIIIIWLTFALHLLVTKRED